MDKNINTVAERATQQPEPMTAKNNTLHTLAERINTQNQTEKIISLLTWSATGSGRVLPFQQLQELSTLPADFFTPLQPFVSAYFGKADHRHDLAEISLKPGSVSTNVAAWWRSIAQAGTMTGAALFELVAGVLWQYTRDVVLFSWSGYSSIAQPPVQLFFLLGATYDNLPECISAFRVASETLQDQALTGYIKRPDYSTVLRFVETVTKIKK